MSPVAGDIPKRARSNVKDWREVRNAIDVLNQRIDNATPGGGGSGNGDGGGGGVTAPNDSAYLLENDTDGANDALLANRRILAAGAGITLTDAGAGSTLIIAADSGGPSTLLTIKTVTANYQMLLTDDFVKADASAGDLTVTLPSVGAAIGLLFRIKRINDAGGAVTVDGIP